jgi:hypothetical protein
MSEENYNIVAKYGYEGYPANPNGSDYVTANDVRHHWKTFSDDATY